MVFAAPTTVTLTSDDSTGPACVDARKTSHKVTLAGLPLNAVTVSQLMVYTHSMFKCVQYATARPDQVRHRGGGSCRCRHVHYHRCCLCLD
jgi:hypothetical protein